MEGKVKQMYTDYTYPKYDKNMDNYAPNVSIIPNALFPEQITHYIYNGSKNFNNYNILVAGVG